MKSLEFCSGGNQTLSEEVAEQAEELNILILGETGTSFFAQNMCLFVSFHFSFFWFICGGNRNIQEGSKLKCLGVGKSTWINAFANYLYFEDLQSAANSEQVRISSCL